MIQAGRPSLNCACENKHRLCADGERGEDRALLAFSFESQIQTDAFKKKMGFPFFLVDARRWSLFNEKKQRVYDILQYQ